MAGRRAHRNDGRAARDPARHAHDRSPAGRGTRGGRPAGRRAPSRARGRGLAPDGRAARRVSRATEQVMARLIYVANISLDGYVADRDGDFAWTDPTREVFSTILELVRPVGTYL